jgi:hypothetical protein
MGFQRILLRWVVEGKCLCSIVVVLSSLAINYDVHFMEGKCRHCAQRPVVHIPD